VQRIAGQAANGPEDSLPFVLDDDAVAPAFQQPLPEQQPSHSAAFGVPEVHTNRPRYGHRSPASALAGNCTCLSCLNAYLLVRSCNTHAGMAAEILKCCGVCIYTQTLRLQAASAVAMVHRLLVPVVSIVSTVHDTVSSCVSHREVHTVIDAFWLWMLQAGSWCTKHASSGLRWAHPLALQGPFQLPSPLHFPTRLPLQLLLCRLPPTCPPRRCRGGLW